MKNIIITIGREYGSGGKYIGQLVAEKLNIPFYDKELINKTYEKTGVSYSKINQYDETTSNSMLKQMHLMNTINSEEAYEAETYQILMSETISELAEKGSCVILGRNSNNILKGKNNVINIFIYSNDLNFKLQRKMKLENISRKEALNKLKKIDKQRKKYYENSNPKHIWGNRYDYDYLIDSSILGPDKTADLIVDIYNQLTNNSSY